MTLAEFWFLVKVMRERRVLGFFKEGPTGMLADWLLGGLFDGVGLY